MRLNVVLSWMALVGTLALPGRCVAQQRNIAAPLRYTVTDLGTLGGPTSEAFGINANGLVVGRSETEGGISHAFLYFPTGWKIRATGAYIALPNGKPAMLDLTPGATERSEARAINRLNRVAGSVFTAGRQQAMVWNGRYEPRLGPNGAYAINDKGEVGGVNLLWQTDQNRTTPPAPFGGESVYDVYGIAETGEAVGAELFDTTHGTTRPFLRRGTQVETLAQPVSKGASGAAYAINSKGKVVGTDGSQAFVWQDGKLTYLNAVLVRSSIAYALNDQGQIVGQADVSWRDQSLHAVLWDKGEMIDLNTRIAPDSGWTLEEARGINARGQICGTGIIGGKRHAFLLTPQSQHP